MPWPKTEETAVLTVNGRDYKDWESVTVKHELGARPPYTCRFTCSEGMPLAKNFAVMQIKPGDMCTVTLAGFPAFTGKVMTRQVYYDSKRHHIEIQCGTFSELSTSTVITPGSEYKDKTFGQIATDVLQKFGYNLKFEGGAAPDLKFPRVSVSPTEPAHDLLEKLLRSATGKPARVTSNENGDFVVHMGPSTEGSDTLTEGKEILIGREILFNQAASGSTPAMSQGPGGDKLWGPKVASGPFAQEQQEFLSKNFFIPSTVLAEMPTSEKEVLKNRGQSENGFLKTDEVTVTLTVYGWLRPSGGLWKRGQTVSVVSPMLIMHGDPLIAKAVTFSQDNSSGTRTTLVLMNEIALSAGGGGVK